MPLGDGDPQHLGHPQRADREVGAAQPEGGYADDHGEAAAASPPRTNASGKGSPPSQSVRVNQRADAEEGRVTEAGLAGKAGQDVPALGQA